MKLFFHLSILILITLSSCKQLREARGPRSPNKLINESSPYLLQHAYNPVDWHPWGEEALQKAKDENKLLIVSVGYAACHWCHVMEHESFEDSTVAAMMNEHFIPIKVDREERPDVDDIYMAAAQLVSGRGGWPLNAFALPDGRPIWAGTYYPKENWMEILKQFAELKDNDYERLESSADQLVSGINSLDEIVVSQPKEYKSEDIQSIANIFLSEIDMVEGGRKGVQKFPRPNNFDYLLKYATLYNNQSALDAVDLTLEKMALGGIYDQAAGGFARYSVDEVWLVPHFEKMLYDNAQLVSLYSDAYRVKKNPLYKHTIEQTLTFIERELMNDQLRFYSSLDADSEGKEGKFYVWSEADIDRLITDPTSNTVVKDYYNIESNGNWEHGNNILHIKESKDKVASKNNISQSKLNDIIASANTTLLNERKNRIRPGLDDKVLTSWNALMIKGYVDAYKALGKREYLDIAIRSAHQLMSDQMQDDMRLLRNYKDGKASINAFLEDYALVIQSFLALYEVTFDESWINVSKDLADYAIAHFYNSDSKMFYNTSDIDPPLIARQSELSDNEIPGSNSMMARNLHRLGELLYDEDFTMKAEQMLSNMWESISTNGQPAFYSNWLQLSIDMVYPPYEVAITGSDAVTTAHKMMETYHPNVVYLGDTQESQLPLLKYKYVDDQTMIYVCQNKTCKLPVTSIEEAEKLLK